MNSKIFSTFLIAVLTCAFLPYCLAKTVSLYEQPKSDAKILSTLDLDKSVSLTIINKEKDWTSIVDPTVELKNARIVWIKTADLPTKNYTFTQTMVNTGKGPHGYILKYGVPTPMTAEQAAAIAKQIRSQQEAIETYFSQMTQSLFNRNQFDMNYPFIMPVIVMPVQNKSVEKEK